MHTLGKSSHLPHLCPVPLAHVHDWQLDQPGSWRTSGMTQFRGCIIFSCNIRCIGLGVNDAAAVRRFIPPKTSFPIAKMGRNWPHTSNIIIARTFNAQRGVYICSRCWSLADPIMQLTLNGVALRCGFGFVVTLFWISPFGRICWSSNNLGRSWFLPLMCLTFAVPGRNSGGSDGSINQGCPNLEL